MSMVMLKKPSSQDVLFTLCGLVLLRKHFNKLCSIRSTNACKVDEKIESRVIKRIRFLLLLELVPLLIRVLTNTVKACTCQTKRRKTKREKKGGSLLPV